MLKDYNFFLNKINEIFESQYINAYKNIKGRNKNEINSYISDIYRKWYFSSLIEGTTLSPANIIAKLKELYAIAPNTFDTPQINKPITQKDCFVYLRADYTVFNHPIVSDLKTIIDCSYPLLELNEYGNASQKTKESLKTRISIHDNYYIDYLLDIAYELKLCEKAPSIYVEVVIQTKAVDAFFKQNNDVIFSKIFDATVSIFVNFLNSPMPLDEHSTDFVMSLLINPINTDDIYKKLYSHSNLDFDMFWNESIDDSVIPPEVKEYLTLGMYYLGIGIDKYFFTPMGYYLKLIQPLYITPAKIDEDVSIVYNNLLEDKEIDTEVYSPCSNYSLTQLCVDFYNVKNSAMLLNTNTVINSDDILDLILSLSESAKNNSLYNKQSIFAKQPENDILTVYQLKITLLSNKRFWITLETFDNTTLSELHFQICYALDINALSTYSFFIGTDETPFKQITPAYNNLRTRKTEATALLDLSLEKDDVLKYVVENNDSIFSNLFSNKLVKFEIKLAKIKENEFAPLFPRIYRKSKFFTDYLNNAEL